MKSGVWKGILAGLALYVVGTAVTYLTPLRIPVLKTAGSEYVALRLQALSAGQDAFRTPSETSAKESATVKPSVVSTRLESWHKRNAKLSVFGFLGWLIDMWPWLIGLGVALPVLGGMIGSQVGTVKTSASRSGGSAGSSPVPATGSASETLPVADGSRPETGETSAAGDDQPAASKVPEPVIPPAAWNWNAPRPAPRAQGRPKPPPVRSPNGDSL